MSVEGFVHVFHQPGAPGDLGMRMVTARALDGAGTPVVGGTLVFTIVDGVGTLGDGEEHLVLLRTDAGGDARCYWYSVADRSAGPDDLRTAVVHVRSEDAAVASIEVSSAD